MAATGIRIQKGGYGNTWICEGLRFAVTKAGRTAKGVRRYRVALRGTGLAVTVDNIEEVSRVVREIAKAFAD